MATAAAGATAATTGAADGFSADFSIVGGVGRGGESAHNVLAILIVTRVHDGPGSGRSAVVGLTGVEAEN